MLIGLVFFNPPLPPLANLPVGLESHFLQLGKAIAAKTRSTGDDSYFSAAAYDAMSLVINTEKGRTRAPFDPLGDVASDEWSKAFTRMCGREPCSLLAFELFEDTKIPSLNAFQYKVGKDSYQCLMHRSIKLFHC